MIFSVTGQREELLAIDERRRQIAAQAAQPPVATTAGLMSGATLPAAGPVVAVKAAEPDVSKRKKGGKRKGREMPAGETALDAVGEGMRAAAADDAGALKASLDRGVREGPGRGARTGPGEPPASYDRPYLTEGHGAPSPQHAGPRENPLSGVPCYVPPSAPQVAAIPPEAIARFTLRSPSE